jgi:hypothetical protein
MNQELSMQGGAVAARLAHNQKVGGAIPPPATNLEPVSRHDAVKAFNAATGYALDPEQQFSPDTLESMCFVALFRGQLHVVKQLKQAFGLN